MYYFTVGMISTSIRFSSSFVNQTENNVILIFARKLPIGASSLNAPPN